MPQISVNVLPDAGQEGVLNGSFPSYVESLECDEATGIPFGRAVSLKSGAALTVDLIASTGEAAAAFGISVRNPTYASNTNTVSDGDMISILRKGVVTVKVEDAVVKGANVFIRHAAGNLGAFRSDVDGGDATEHTGMEYLDNAGAGGFARVWVK